MSEKKRGSMVAWRKTLSLLALLIVFPFLAGTAELEEGEGPLPVAETLPGNYLAARFANNHADLSESARFFAEALAQDPNDPFLLERTLTLSLAAGDMENAMLLAHRLAAVDKGSRLAALALGIDAFKDKEWEEAVTFLRGAAAGPLATLSVEIVSAWAEAGAGKIDAALKRLDQLKAEEWFTFFRTYHAGLIAAAADRHDEAIRFLGEAYRIDKGSARVLEAYGRALVRGGKPDAAKRTIAEAMKATPDHPLLGAIQSAIDKGQKPQALIGSAAEGAAEILAGIGAAIARDDESELAAIYLRLALHLHPKADLARLTLAELLERSKQYEKAITLLEGVSGTSPLKRSATIQIGFYYNALDRVDEARAHFEGLIRDNPRDIEAITALGNMLRVRKMFEEASAVYSKAVALIEEPKPEHWVLFYNRGITFERTKRWPEAEADFKKALVLSPDQPFVLNYLGYSWVDQGMNYEEALKMIKKAVALEPQDGYIVDSLGWAYYKLGRYDEAVRELERAISLKPADPVINDHLGDAYWQVGRKVEARFQWNHAKDAKPEPEDLKKILHKLENGLDAPAHRTTAGRAGKPEEKAPLQVPQ